MGLSIEQKWDVFRTVFYLEACKYEPSIDFVEHWDEYAEKFNRLILILETPVKRKRK